MKKHLTATILLLGLTTQTTYASPLGEFDGEITIKTVSAGCGFTAVGPADTLMRYRPPGIGSNGTATNITLRKWSPDGDVQDYRLESGSLVGTAMVPVVFTQIGWIAQRGTASMRITNQTPATITSATRQVKLNARITGFGGDSNCTVTLGATLFSY